MKPLNATTLILLLMIAALIGWNYYTQTKLDAEKEKNFGEQITNQDIKIDKYKEDLVEIVDSLLKIRSTYKVIEKQRETKNEAIKNINDADSIANEFNKFWASKSKGK